MHPTTVMLRSEQSCHDAYGVRLACPSVQSQVRSCGPVTSGQLREPARQRKLALLSRGRSKGYLWKITWALTAYYPQNGGNIERYQLTAEYISLRKLLGLVASSFVSANSMRRASNSHVG